MKNQVQLFSLYLGLCSFSLFLMSYAFPKLQYYSLLMQAISILVIFLGLFLFFKEIKTKRTNLKYHFLIKNGLYVGFLSGLLAAILFFIFSNYIDQHYLEKVAFQQIEFMKNSGYQKFEINKNLRLMGMMNKFHFEELTIILSNLLKSLACSLVLTPFFLQRKDD